MPVADDREDQQQESDQQQPGGFRRIHGMLMLLVSVVGFERSNHADIVALSLDPRSSGRIRPGNSSRLARRTKVSADLLNYGVVHACAAKQQPTRALWSV